MAEQIVQDNLVVSIDYTLALDNGETVDTTVGDTPVEILQGSGEVIPGLESALYGMRVGERKQIVVPPEQAFGDYEGDDSRMSVPRDQFPDEVEWEEGMEVYVQTEENEEEEVAYIVQLTPAEIVLDFNHPLAGKTLHVDVTVRGLRAATPEELEHGHAHSEDWEEEEYEEWDEGEDGGEDGGDDGAVTGDEDEGAE